MAKVIGIKEAEPGVVILEVRLVVRPPEFEKTETVVVDKSSPLAGELGMLQEMLVPMMKSALNEKVIPGSLCTIPVSMEQYHRDRILVGDVIDVMVDVSPNPATKTQDEGAPPKEVENGNRD